jgi:CheY-like chemotaxis protein
VDHLELTFDQIIGPEEVVVRPLPPLLRAQQLFAGVTLSGAGRIVLVLDPAKLMALPGAAEPKRSIRAAKAKHGTILVVDDSLSSRRHVSLMLRQRGWETVEATDGIAALDKLEPRLFDAVITDFEMPRMDGAQLIHAIRSQPKFLDIPIFMISSLPPESIRERVMQEGVNSYCQKPIEDEELDQLLQLIEVRRNQQ